MCEMSFIEPTCPQVNRDYEAMCSDYYTLQFMDRSVDTSPIAPALAAFFDNVLDASVSTLNFKVCLSSEQPSHSGLSLTLISSSVTALHSVKAIVDGLGEVLFR